DPERLVQLATAALATDPHSTAYRLWLGAAQYRAGRFEQALRSLEAVTRSDTGWTNSEAWPLLAMTHPPPGHAEEARRWLEKTREGLEQTIWEVRGHPFDVRLFNQNAFDLLEVYLFYREAHALLEGFPAPDHPLRWIVQARGHATLGQLDQASADFTRAIELRPEDPKLWLARGFFSARRGKWQEASADY